MEKAQDSNKTTNNIVPQNRRLRHTFNHNNHNHNHNFNHNYNHNNNNYQYHNNYFLPYNNHNFFYNHPTNNNSYRLNGFYNHQNLQQNNYQGILPIPQLLPSNNHQYINHNHRFNAKTHFHKPHKSSSSHVFINNDSKVSPSTISQANEEVQHQMKSLSIKSSSVDPITRELVVAKRPDCGGVEGQVISLLANHFRVKFDTMQPIFHYNVDISPSPSKEVARVLKKKLIEENSSLFSGACPAYDGRKNLYSTVEFKSSRLEFFVSLPVAPMNNPCLESDNRVEQERKVRRFRINVNLVSKLEGSGLGKYLSKDGGDECVQIPQEYLHALDVVLRENPNEKCVPSGRSLYSTSMGGAKEIGGAAIGLRGFFQSLRPTQQGLALNVDFSVTAFHESIGVIPYLQKRVKGLHDLTQRKDRSLTENEKVEVEKALKNVRLFVCHRETVQRYRFSSLTEEITEKLWFNDRDGSRLKLVEYFKEHYDYEIQYRNLPCIQISRTKPCYLPMELCMICEGQKFLGKLSDDQTARIMKMGCQKPRERRTIIDGVMNGPVGPTSGNQVEEFKLQVSKEMTRLKGRILLPPKLKLGEGGFVRDVLPSRNDRQWSLLGGHVVDGTRIEKWALISFGGTPAQRSYIPKFMTQLSLKCEQMGIFLNKCTCVAPQFEPIHVLSNVTLLESKLRKIKREASNSLQLLLCVMEKKHKGYGDLKRIAETQVGVLSQCCLYSNLEKPSSQFLANMALKINAKVGGSTVSLFNPLSSQIPRLFKLDDPIIFMGADVTHPHPLDDSSPSVAAIVGSLNWPSANKYVSRIQSQTHRQEIIENLAEMVSEILSEFLQEVKKLPSRIIFFRDGVSETQFYKVLKEELMSIREGCNKFPDYTPSITFSVVQKRHHTRLFPDENDPRCAHLCNDNVAPGTVVDTVITHPREFDFYLCSHFGVKGTSRPAHYHVLWDENKFSSDEIQKLVYVLCFTFVRCTKPISIVPPAYYAHLAAYRGRLYLDKSESFGYGKDASTRISRVGTPKATPLPTISENVRKLMFYC